MTNGSPSGTSGVSRPRLGPWSTVAIVGVVVAFVTASSELTEINRSGSDVHWLEPILWEVTSAATIIAMAPLIGLAVNRWPPSEDNWLRPGLIHLALTIPFAMAHVLSIFVLREAAYWAAGEHYGYFDDDGVLGTYIYEWRKDVLIYGAIGAVYWREQHKSDQPPPPQPGDNRIEIRDGATAVFLAPADILFLEAAGNYVEFRTAGATHLVRGTLAAWEARLVDRGFIRVHRARIVNRARIAAIKPTPSGDAEITLDTGATLTASRRYRSALETEVST